MTKRKQRRLEDYPALRPAVENLAGVQKAVRKLRRKVRKVHVESQRLD